MTTPDPAAYADRVTKLLEHWHLLSDRWREAAVPLYAGGSLYPLRDWEKARVAALEKMFEAQEQFNLMVVAAIDALRKDLADRGS